MIFDKGGMPWCAWDGETLAEVIPERDFELGAGFGMASRGSHAVVAMGARRLTFRLVTWIGDPACRSADGRTAGRS
jgi:hypothetical protein